MKTDFSSIMTLIFVWQHAYCLLNDIYFFLPKLEKEVPTSFPKIF